MRQSTIARTIPVGLGILGVVLLYVWLSADAAIDLTERIPAPPDDTQALQGEATPVKIQGTLAQLDGVPTNLPGAWPRFRGPNFDAISSEDISPARTWPTKGPEVFWSIDVGEGFAGASIFSGRVYLIDYDREKQADVVRCLSLEDGKDIWQYSYPVKIKRDDGTEVPCDLSGFDDGRVPLDVQSRQGIQH